MSLPSLAPVQRQAAASPLPMLSSKDVWRAIRQNCVHIYLQPIVDLATCEIKGVEALARISHDDCLISPARFMPTIEQDPDLSAAFDYCVVLATSYRIQKTLNEGKSLPPVQINLSPISFDERGCFADRFLDLVDNFGFAPERISFEIVETGSSDFSPSSHDLLRNVVSRKTKIIQDDHGGGAHDQARWRDISAYTHEVKTDAALLKYPDKLKALVEALHRQGCTVTIEGIETLADLKLARSSEAAKGQGYFLARPQPLAFLQNWICSDTQSKFHLPALHVANVGRGRSSGVVPPTPQP